MNWIVGASLMGSLGLLGLLAFIAEEFEERRAGKILGYVVGLIGLVAVAPIWAATMFGAAILVLAGVVLPILLALGLLGSLFG